MKHSNPQDSSKDSSKDQMKPIVPDSLEAIVTRKSKKSAAYYAKEAQKNRVSRRIELAKKNDFCDVVCDVTGTVSILNIPRIHGFALIWTSPLASLENCRGIVQRGTLYLESLDTQILAGLLITLSDDYSLFQYQPTYSGAQKNAIIRSAGRDVIIASLGFIETYVNSGNALYLPRLSLILTASTVAGEIESKINEWLKLAATKIKASSYREDDTEDAFYKEAPKKTISVPLISREKAIEARLKKASEALAKNLISQETRSYKADIKTAKLALKTFLKEEKVSPKLSGLLKTIFTEESLVAMDSSMRFLVASKLDSFSSSSSSTLIAILKKPYARLRTDSIDDLDSNDSNDSTEPTTIMALDFHDSPSKKPSSSISSPTKMSIMDKIKAARASIAFTKE